MSGLAVTVGVSRVDLAAYDGSWDGSPLEAPESDADRFAVHCRRRGLKAVSIRGRAGTREHILGVLKEAAATVQPEELLAFFFSGHGGYVPNDPQDRAEEGTRDETLCCYDGMILDDELKCVWSEVHPGARIFSCADSCHSGSVQSFRFLNVWRQMIGQRVQVTKRAPDQALEETYRRNKAFYDSLQARAVTCEPIRASLIHIGACEDDQLTTEYRNPPRGAFSMRLERVLTAEVSYADAYQQLKRDAPRSQSPTWRTEGLADSFFPGMQILT